MQSRLPIKLWDLLFTISIIFLLIVLFACGSRTDTIEGIVVDENGNPLQGAVVRVKATYLSTETDSQGRFHLTGMATDTPVFVTAWLSGYYINGVADVQPGSEEIGIILHEHTAADNPDYAWLPSMYHDGLGENQGCAQCHSASGTDLTYTLPVDEWLMDAHSGTVTNARFLSMYSGTDLDGNQSPMTQYFSSRDYGSLPLPPDPNEPYYGPGYQLDFSNTLGNCAACHAPAAAINAAYVTDPTQVSEVEAEGISCDFCHKIWDINLDPETGLPFANMPGVLSYVFRRPPDGHQFFAGPLDDVAPGEDTYSPLQEQSQFCAGCHYGVFWDIPIYNSYGEWLESDYSNPETGSTCQDCHMPHTDATTFALIDQGGVERDPETIFSHRMPGASDEALLQNSVTMSVTSDRNDNDVFLTVTIVNDRTGHHIPTDSPLRQLILVVTAMDQNGSILSLTEGPVLPDWAGLGDPEQGYYAGLPGVGYARILSEIWTGISPTGAYWNPVREVSDTRIPAMGEDSSNYVFAANPDQVINININLYFRRAFIELMDQKNWQVSDILMESQTIQLPAD